jgi:hypothetical protein
MTKRMTLLAIIAATILYSSTTALSQSNRTFVKLTDNALNQVPSRVRARLIVRLELYIKSLNKAEFGNVYDLKPEACRGSLAKNEWLKQVRDESPGRIQRFVIEKVYTGDYTAPENLQGEKWIVTGCGTYKKGKKSVRYNVSYSMLLQNEEWYICTSGIAIQGAANEYIRCPE